MQIFLEYIGRYIHFVDHDIITGVVATSKNSLQIGYIDAVIRYDPGDGGDQTLFIRSASRIDKGLTFAKFQAWLAVIQRFDKNIQSQVLQAL